MFAYAGRVFRRVKWAGQQGSHIALVYPEVGHPASSVASCQDHHLNPAAKLKHNDE
jgi:hypothetical protein